jgi:hypothetical protein
MRISINRIDFEVAAVPAQTRMAVLSDPFLAQAIWRDVYRWDAAAGTGEVIARVAPNGAVPLPNGIAFFVPRVTATGQVAKAEGPSRKMAERFLQATGAKSIGDLLAALNRILHLPQKTIPLAPFAPLNPYLSYTLRMETEYAVVRLAHAGRNLSAFVLIPGQVGFRAIPGEVRDPAGWEAALAATPALAAIRPGFIVPPQTEANAGMRRLALARRMEELQAEVAAGGGNAAATPGQRGTAARLMAEWRLLAPVPQKAANGAA